MYYLAEIALALPYPLDQILANFASKKISLIFTNVFGPAQPLKIAGAKSLKVKTIIERDMSKSISSKYLSLNLSF